METVSYKHSCNAGDLISSMPGMKHVYDTLGKKAKVYQRIGLLASYYQGAKHPIKNENGDMVCMNWQQFIMLKPLIEAQEYVESFEVWEGHVVDIDLDLIRNGEFSTLPWGDIKRWQFYTHPLLACDLSKAWINAARGTFGLTKDKVIVNFTSRYRNQLISYYFLKEWEDRIVFAGTEEEHSIFCLENKLDIPYLKVNDFLELSGFINECKFILSNQSFCYNLAEGMKKLRILEVCRFASNCIPNGADGYDFLQQGALEIYFNKFIK